MWVAAGRRGSEGRGAARCFGADADVCVGLAAERPVASCGSCSTGMLDRAGCVDRGLDVDAGVDAGVELEVEPGVIATPSPTGWLVAAGVCDEDVGVCVCGAGSGAGGGEVLDRAAFCGCGVDALPPPAATAAAGTPRLSDKITMIASPNL